MLHLENNVSLSLCAKNCSVLFCQRRSVAKRLFDSVPLMNQDGRKLENKTPMEIIYMDRNTELKRLLLNAVKRGVSTLQEKQYLPKQQIMPSAKCCKQNHMNTRLFDLSFCSIPVLFFRSFYIVT